DWPTRCENASPSRPNGGTKPREDSSSAPTGLSGCPASSSSSEDRSSEVGKRNIVRLRKNICGTVSGKGRGSGTGRGAGAVPVRQARRRCRGGAGQKPSPGGACGSPA